MAAGDVLRVVFLVVEDRAFGKTGVGRDELQFLSHVVRDRLVSLRGALPPGGQLLKGDDEVAALRLRADSHTRLLQRLYEKGKAIVEHEKRISSDLRTGSDAAMVAANDHRHPRTDPDLARRTLELFDGLPRLSGDLVHVAQKLVCDGEVGQAATGRLLAPSL